MTTVINIKSKKSKCDVYIGRGSKWGNPFVMKDWSDEERNRVCDEYEKWFYTQQHLVDSLPELKDKILGCWCKNLGGGGKSCHGDILVKWVKKTCN
jgi:hypothetical protein